MPTLKEIFDAKVAHMVAAELKLRGLVSEHQQRLYELILAEYMPQFELKDGLIIDSPANDAMIAKIDRVFARLEKALYRDVLGEFVSGLLKSAELSGEYYIGLGFQKQVVTGLLRDKVRLESKLGITSTGRIKEGGYIDRLGKTNEVKQRLAKYVVTNLTGDTSFLDFQLGMRNLVIGNKRVKGLATNGALEQYFDQYAYDTYNITDATANKQLASNLNLNHFIYQGSVIDTTRKFCKERAGKAFKVSDTLDWKNDPNLIDKKTKDEYRPLIDRGRYRCRHRIRYVTETIYNQFK